MADGIAALSEPDVSPPSDPPLSDFTDWFQSVIDEVKPELIVGIARGAIRLLQLHGNRELLGQHPLISQHAVPFLRNSQLQGKRTLLFDDSVIFGSMMARYGGYLQLRGAQVFAAAYAVDRQNFLGESQNGRARSQVTGRPSPHSRLFIRFRHKLWPAEIRRHHACIVRSVLQSPMDYNLDFPDFLIRVDSFSRGDIPFMIHRLRALPGLRGLWEVPTAASAASNVHRFTGLLDSGLPGALTANGIYCRPYSKVRICFMPEHGEIRMTPLIQFSMDEAVAYEDIVFRDKRVEAMWRTLEPPAHVEDPFYHPSLFRLLTAFGAVVLAVPLVHSAASALGQNVANDSPQLSRNDVGAILGERNAGALKKAWERFVRLKEQPGCGDTLFSQACRPDYPNAPALRSAIVGAWNVKPQLRPRNSETLPEAVGKILLTLQNVTDSQEARIKNPDASRLDVGLTFESVRSLLTDAGINVTSDMVSLAIDTCVDGGLAVPRVIKEDGVWLRAFYCGEDENDQALLLFKSAFHSAYSNFSKASKGRVLDRFDVQKLCSSLKDILPWLPISTKFHTYGRVATVGRSQIEILEWLTDESVGPLRSGVEGARQVLRVNDSFVPAVESTWSAEHLREFFDAFDYLSRAFLRLSDGAKLLLSTCRTHRYTFNAVAYELHQWAGEHANQFGHLTEVLAIAVKKGEPAHHVVMADAYWCLIYIAEALKKVRVFVDFNKHIAELDKKIGRQGDGAARWWQFLKTKKLLNSDREDEIDRRFTLLIPLLNQASYLTIFALGSLGEAGVASPGGLEDEFKRHGISLSNNQFSWYYDISWRAAASKYNEALSKQIVPGVSLFMTNLPADLCIPERSSLEAWALDLTARVRACYSELARAIREFCPEYEVPEGELPYAPDTNKRLLADGSTEVDHTGMFILTMDIIGSTNSESGREFKEVIRLAMHRFANKGIYFDETRNDSFMACSVDPKVVWDLARSLSHRAEHMILAIDKFAGTRKGLTFGSVTVLTRPNGTSVVGDVQGLHVLPKAFTMLGCVDKEVSPEQRNRVLLIENDAYSRLGSVIDTTPLKTVAITGKHISSQGVIVLLD